MKIISNFKTTAQSYILLSIQQICAKNVISPFVSGLIFEFFKYYRNKMYTETEVCVFIKELTLIESNKKMNQNN